MHPLATAHSERDRGAAAQEGRHPFNYPPTYLFLIWPLGGLSYSVALIVWQLLTLALFAFGLRMAGLRPIEVLAAIVAPVTILNFSGGQNGCLTSALIIGGLALLARRQIAAGGLFGLLTVKPHLGLLVPVVCLAERRWWAIVAAGCVTIALVGASILVFGPASWEAYLGFLGGFQAQAQAQTSGTFLNYSATVLMAEQIMGLPKALAYGVQIAISLGVSLAVYRAYRRPAGATPTPFPTAPKSRARRWRGSISKSPPWPRKSASGSSASTGTSNKDAIKTGLRRATERC
jgi:hypothetical protein